MEDGLKNGCSVADEKAAKNRELQWRVGRMWIPNIMIVHDTIRMADMFGLLKFIPLRGEYMRADNRLELTGVSPLFDMVTEGEQIPEYVIEIQSDENGDVKSIKACRRK